MSEVAGEFRVLNMMFAVSAVGTCGGARILTQRVPGSTLTPSPHFIMEGRDKMKKKSPMVVDRDNWEHEASRLRAVNAKLLAALEAQGNVRDDGNWHSKGCHPFRDN
ncbi:hypothetical protein LCGC14_2085020, partial [marine sediment metagenome]